MYEKDKDDRVLMDEEEEDHKVRDAIIQELRSDPMCPTTKDEAEELEWKEKKKKEVPKESYYEKLLKRQKERESKDDTPEKKPKIEPLEQEEL